jgi:hypothetical protein
MLDWTKLVWLSDEALGALDIAEVNLACAAGLPGSDQIDVGLCIRTLNAWASWVHNYTSDCLSQLRPDREVSKPEFRVRCLGTVLWRGAGVTYNAAKIPETAPSDLQAGFIHGAVVGEGGTCATLPVIYAAVGRRLGYPIRLGTAMVKEKGFGHCFARWGGADDTRLNFEVNHTGVHCAPDEYYRTGQYAITAKEERLGCLLRSLTPREELSHFMILRAECWLDQGNLRPAANALAWAYALQPGNIFLKNSLITTLNDWGSRLNQREPPGFPTMCFYWPPVRRFPASLPWQYEKDILSLESWENILNNPDHETHFWSPLRRGEPVGRRPMEAVIKFNSVNESEIGLHFEAERAGKGVCPINMATRV